MLNDQKRAWLQPFSIRDIGLSALFNSGVIAIWNFGDFHSFHYGDTVVFSLISIYRWTVFAWEYDHVGSFILLLVSFIKRPYWNLLALDGLTSFLFLGGLALWSALLSFRKRTLVESCLWIALLISFVIAKKRIFANAAHGITSGAAFFFAGLFVLCLLCYLKSENRLARFALMIMLFAFSFLAAFLAKPMLILMGFVTLGLIWPDLKKTLQSLKNVWHPEGNRSSGILALAPLLCLATAFLVYQQLEQRVPIQYRSDFTLNVFNIPTILPRLFRNWAEQELTTPLPLLVLLSLPFHLSSVKAALARNPLLAYLAAGIAVEAMIVSSSKWVILNEYSGYYLTDLGFLLLLAIVAFGVPFVERVAPPRIGGGLSAIIFIAAIIVNVHEWNALRPMNPIARLDDTIGEYTSLLIEAQCDIILGDYHKVWPPMIAVNDYYYRHHMVDPRTGSIRWVAAIAARTAPTEDLWQPMLDWPDAKICAFVGDALKIEWAAQTYIPDHKWFITPLKQVGPIIVSKLRNRKLTSMGFEFDYGAPGFNWHSVEHTSEGQAFQWMSATTSTLVLPLAIDRDLAVRFRILRSLALDILQNLTFTVNDHPVPLTAQADNMGGVIFRAIIPQEALAANSRATEFAFHINRTVVPQLMLPNSDDPRSLGLAFDWLKVDPVNGR